nr:F-box/FBD/LRR-repeat protein At1g13570-like [Ipomoea batatas]
MHNGTIRKFVMSFYCVEIRAIRSRSYDFDQWLLLVTRKGVEEIYIRFDKEAYRLPGCVFSCSTLKRVHLYGVVVEPINFPCILPNVASLCFECVEFGPINCLDCAIDVPVLEKLSFIRCLRIFHFDITVLKLCSLTIEFCLSTVMDKFLPVNLDLRSISTLDLGGHLQFPEVFFLLSKHTLNVEYLKLSCFYEFYTKSDRSSSVFVHLLRLCPKLHKLDIKSVWFDSMATKHMDILSELHAVSLTNKMLNVLKFMSFQGLQIEKLFIKELLASFSTLEKVVIVREKHYRKKDSTGIMQELLDLPFASTKMKIIIV